MKSHTPQDLMRLVQEGDQEAFGELVRRYKTPLVSFAWRMLNDQEKAIDVAQETFVSVFTHAAGYRPMASFTGWLYRIAYNLSINEIRRQRRQPTVPIDRTTAPEDERGPRRDVCDPGDSVEERLLGTERHEMVRRCVASLPIKYRGAVVMKDMEGMTFEEIARVLNCPESTVKSRVMRARRMLRERLEPHVLRGAAAGAQPVPVREGRGN